MHPSPSASARDDAAVLRWQSRIRFAIASIAAIGALLFVASPDPHPLTGLPVVPFILLATLGYTGSIAAVAWFAQRWSNLAARLLFACTAADVLFTVTMVAGVSAPAYAGRVLVFAFFPLILATGSAVRGQALIAIVLSAGGYLALVATGIARGAPLEWREEFWSLAVFVMVAALIAAEQSAVAGRLERIVRLFARAEEGDFSQAYDEDADPRPDAVSRLGRAYNRVRVQLASMVLTDPLTGCLNRRGFDSALAREVARATRSGGELAMLALDVDHFKTVNDTHGHPAGDVVLQQLGALLRRLGREGDIVARTGGEEFCVLLPDTRAHGAFRLGSRICEEVRGYRFGNPHQPVGITVSIGVAAADRWDRSSASLVGTALKARADDALYSAKRGGRDRARSWAPAAPDQLDLGVGV